MSVADGPRVGCSGVPSRAGGERSLCQDRGMVTLSPAMLEGTAEHTVAQCWQGRAEHPWLKSRMGTSNCYVLVSPTNGPLCRALNQQGMQLSTSSPTAVVFLSHVPPGGYFKSSALLSHQHLIFIPPATFHSWCRRNQHLQSGALSYILQWSSPFPPSLSAKWVRASQLTLHHGVRKPCGCVSQTATAQFPPCSQHKPGQSPPSCSPLSLPGGPLLQGRYCASMALAVPHAQRPVTTLCLSFCLKTTAELWEIWFSWV